MRTIASETSFEIGGERPVVVDLRDREATSLDLVGAKAASLARSAAAGLPVLPGFVLTTALDSVAITGEAVRQAWRAMSDDGRIALVVRSSATKEDGETSSMAGLFVSRLDVRGWDAFVEAVADVLASKDEVTGDHGRRRPSRWRCSSSPTSRRRGAASCSAPIRSPSAPTASSSPPCAAGPIASSAARSTVGRRR